MIGADNYMITESLGRIIDTVASAASFPSNSSNDFVITTRSLTEDAVTLGSTLDSLFSEATERRAGRGPELSGVVVETSYRPSDVPAYSQARHDDARESLPRRTDPSIRIRRDTALAFLRHTEQPDDLEAVLRFVHRRRIEPTYDAELIRETQAHISRAVRRYLSTLAYRAKSVGATSFAVLDAADSFPRSIQQGLVARLPVDPAGAAEFLALLARDLRRSTTGQRVPIAGATLVYRPLGLALLIAHSGEAA